MFDEKNFPKQFLFILLLICSSAPAQEYKYPINRDMETRITGLINSDTTGFFTSVKPYIAAELKKAVPVDSVWKPQVGDSKFYSTWVGRKIFKEHLIDVNEDDIRLSIDPVFNLQVGKDQKAKRTTYVNTRGVLIQGNYIDKLYFYTEFHENQARYSDYVDSFVRKYNVVPGQGKVKFLDNEAFDFSQATGGVAYTLNRHFDFLLASEKIFIGDGYRSLLLSDNAYSYPFLRINMSFWKFRYTIIYAVMQDLLSAHDPNVGYFKKYSTTHYLDVNIGKKNKVSAGIFETVMWKQAASRGYELSYLNPMIFLRPVENSLDSPDNVLLGLNLRWKVNRKNTVYAQLMLDEFLMAEIRSGNGWWGNKQGIQFGYKSADLFRIKSLNFQSEINFVRPYTYQHRSSEQNYAHYNQALAHPLGANFIESVTFLNYRWRNFFVELKYQYVKNAQDTIDPLTGNEINFGNDIFKNYEDHGDEHGHYMFDGLQGKINSVDVRLNYLINPKTNFNVEVGMTMRRFSNIYKTEDTQLLYFGIRTSLENYYFDF